VVTMVRQAMVHAGPGPSPRNRPRARSERLGGKLVQDPNCGTYLPEDRAISIQAGSDVRHFCSVACRDQWQSVQRRER
jgi:uncharacterized protein